MKLLEMMVNHKINNMNPDDLISIGRQYGVQLNQTQAKGITQLLAGKNINIFDLSQRQQVLQQISAITGTETSKKIESIFKQLTNS
ncbi:DUF2624 family protein [Actinomycetes bacterium NPDC127524]|jgi:hypothetical protein|uniref:DUF2624 family protein n=1 Tax=Bacillaceae TaxID=186817 RepID=UPI0008EFAEA0|nr:DUF2624 family protein [Bacillus sp. OV322]SFC38803.1 Protein of unknown function [Bacillus sp. OV322]